MASPVIIIGLGKTGQSCANYFAKKNIAYKLLDTQDLTSEDKKLIENTRELILSPGISPERFPHHNCISDIELFASKAKAPIIGITGTNAKGTVVTLLGEMIKGAGLNVLVGGNIGTPALDLLEHKTPDFYVLEISSFQLEITHFLPLIASTILNLTPDHLDRHKTMENYKLIKQKIYQHSNTAVYNREDNYTYPVYNTPHRKNFGLTDIKIPLKIKGRHNYLNAAAAFALGQAIGLPEKSMLETLKNFPGLEHRCEWLISKNNIDWYNDSKGTNIGATIAALEGLGTDKNIILIAGGLGKNQDFSLLRSALEKYTKTIILLGKDRDIINQAINNKGILVDSLREAVIKAKELAHKNDIVLLSPACASMDMFKDFEDRGRQFKNLVRELI